MDKSADQGQNRGRRRRVKANRAEARARRRQAPSPARPPRRTPAAAWRRKPGEEGYRGAERRDQAHDGQDGGSQDDNGGGQTAESTHRASAMTYRRLASRRAAELPNRHETTARRQSSEPESGSGASAVFPRAEGRRPRAAPQRTATLKLPLRSRSRARSPGRAGTRAWNAVSRRSRTGPAERTAPRQHGAGSRTNPRP